MAGTEIHTPYCFSQQYVFWSHSDNTLVSNFIFGRYEFSLKKQSGDMEKFYYNPEIPIVPLMALAYHEVFILITLVNPSIAPPAISVVFGTLNDKLSRSTMQSNHWLNRKSNKNRIFYVTNGFGNYISDLKF